MIFLKKIRDKIKHKYMYNNNANRKRYTFLLNAFLVIISFLTPAQGMTDNEWEPHNWSVIFIKNDRGHIGSQILNSLDARTLGRAKQVSHNWQFLVNNIHDRRCAQMIENKNPLLKTNVHFTNLTDLSLKNSNMGDEEVKILAFGHLYNLTLLDLSGNSIGDAGATFMKNFTNLRELHLAGNNLGEKGTQILAQITNLKFLNLQRNNLEDSQIWDIFDSNATLWGLVPVNWIYYRPALIQSYKSSRLNLVVNNYNNRASREIAKALENNNVIVSLNLENTMFYGIGGDEYAYMLEKNSTLQYLRLNLYIIDSNEFAEKYIENALKTNTTFKSLELGFHSTDLFSGVKSEKILKFNRNGFWYKSIGATSGSNLAKNLSAKGAEGH